MHHPPDKMKGHAIKGIPPSSEIELVLMMMMMTQSKESLRVILSFEEKKVLKVLSASF